MESFRLFLIRLLQVLWVLLVSFSVFAVFIEDSSAFFEFLIMGGIPLLILQFLIFASLNPLELFDGSTKENLIN